MHFRGKAKAHKLIVLIDLVEGLDSWKLEFIKLIIIKDSDNITV